MRTVISLTAGASVAFLAGCGGSAGETSSPSAQTPPPAAAPKATTEAVEARVAGTRGRVVKVRSTRYGKILVDGSGRALYLFTRETSAKARCYGTCARAWPPFITNGKPRAGTGADASLVGSVARRGGKRQVTYKGHPLYYYVTDRKPGQVTCQNVVEFGGTWLVVAPNGRAIR